LAIGVLLMVWLSPPSAPTFGACTAFTVDPHGNMAVRP
jgi:hypothetical protein